MVKLINPTNYLSVFDRFVGLALKGSAYYKFWIKLAVKICSHLTFRKKHAFTRIHTYNNNTTHIITLTHFNALVLPDWVGGAKIHPLSSRPQLVCTYSTPDVSGMMGSSSFGESWTAIPEEIGRMYDPKTAKIFFLFLLTRRVST